RNIDDDLGAARQRLFEDRTVRIPNVLADTDPDGCAIHLQYGAAITWLEIPKFVENSVIWKIDLVVSRDQFSILNNGGGIKDVVLAIDEADDGSNAARAAHHFLERGEIRIDELRFQQK